MKFRFTSERVAVRLLSSGTILADDAQPRGFRDFRQPLGFDGV